MGCTLLPTTITFLEQRVKQLTKDFGITSGENGNKMKKRVLL